MVLWLQPTAKPRSLEVAIPWGWRRQVLVWFCPFPGTGWPVVETAGDLAPTVANR